MDTPVSSVIWREFAERPERALVDLFDAPVFASGGETDESNVDQLSALALQEIPEGYHRWVEKRQREYRAGRHHARLALIEAGADAPMVRRGEDGMPLFPTGFHGSITHTGRKQTFAAAVITGSSVRIGIDAENHKSMSQGMVDAILHPAEQRRFHQSTRKKHGAPPELGDFALWVFSMKEAFYKCTYPYCAAPFGFLDVDVEVDPEGQQFLAKLLTKSYPDVPNQLNGLYHVDEKRIVCGVTWKSP